MSTAIRQYWQYVVKMAHRIGHGRLDAEDLAQDVFERWMRAAPGLPPTTNQLAWMTVVLRRLATARVRRRRVAAEVTAEVMGGPGGLPAAERDSAPWWLNLETGDITRVLGELPSAQRAAFHLYEVEGKSYDEIASELR